MASITRDRGCLYYVPWIATICACFGIASLGVWANYTKICKDMTFDALGELDVDARNLDRITPALIATAASYLAMTLLIFVFSLWRSFIEAAHDATGIPARGAVAFMVLCFLLNSAWYLMVLWLVLLLMANTIWSSTLYVVRGSIMQAQTDILLYGPATWLPSRQEPCPGQCLDLTTFVFISSEVKDACVCDSAVLEVVRKSFDEVYDLFIAVLVGNSVMLISAICLLMNYACQFSHTKRERELLMRAGSKAYSGI